nr:unnamed protein product [Digitaria exilis]
MLVFSGHGCWPELVDDTRQSPSQIQTAKPSSKKTQESRDGLPFPSLPKLPASSRGRRFLAAAAGDRP